MSPCPQTPGQQIERDSVAGMSPETDPLTTLRSRARSAGLAKALLGAVGVPLVTTVMTWVLIAGDAPGFIVACVVLLGLAQAGYLVLRGVRQMRIAAGEVHPAVVLDAVRQGAGRKEDQGLTFVLRLELQLDAAGGAAIPVVVTSTNVFGESRAKSLEGERISVIWHPAYPGDAYAVVD